MSLVTRIFLCLLGLSYKNPIHGRQVNSLIKFAEVTCRYSLKYPALLSDEGEDEGGPMSTEDKVTRCMYEFLGILKKDGSIADVDMMGFTLGYAFKESNYQKGSELAAEIHRKCAKKVVSRQNTPTKLLRPFFKCVSKIIKIGEPIKSRGYVLIDPEKLEKERLMKINLTAEEIKNIVPKLDCHKSYNLDTSNPEWGEGRRIFNYKFCKYGKGQETVHCIPRCMAESFGLLYGDGFRKIGWNTKRSMINRLRPYFIGYDYNAASALANKIFKQCRKKVLKMPVLRYPCNTRSYERFFSCVDPILNCALHGKRDYELDVHVHNKNCSCNH